MAKTVSIALLFICVFVAGYALGHYNHKRVYKKSAIVEDALNDLPESLAISVISGSEIARKYPHVELGNLTTFYETNHPGK
jgi:hypothetical protein